MRTEEEPELFDLVKKAKRRPRRSSSRPPVVEMHRQLRDAADFHRRRCGELRQEPHRDGFTMGASISAHERFAEAIETALEKLSITTG